MVKVYFHNTLVKYTNTSEQEFEVNNINELISAIINTFPKIAAFINKEGKNSIETLAIIYDKKYIVPDKWLLRDHFPENKEEFWIVPVLCGSGRIGKVLAGVALVAIGAYFGGFGAEAGQLGSFLGFDIAKSLVGIGVNLILGALLQREFKPPEPNLPVDAGQRRNNDVFDGLANSVDSGSLVLLNYGQMRVAGHFISGYVKTIDHGRNDIINVGEQF